MSCQGIELFVILDLDLLMHLFARYLFALQIKKDLAEGYLICSPSVSAMLASFIVQGKWTTFETQTNLTTVFEKFIFI